MLDAPISYNGQQLNTTTLLGDGLRQGCIIEEFDFGRAAGVGYTEKRSQDDGLDASDVYMGPRYISLSGTIYGADRADLFDRLQSLRRAFTPTVAYEQDIDDHGYLPLQFSLPTDDTAFGAAKELEFRCRPVGQPQFAIRRDTGAFPQNSPHSNADEKGGAISWRVTLECKDPRMYVRPDTWVPFTTAKTGASIVNRGDYPAPLDILLGVTSSASGSRIEIDVGGSTIAIYTGTLSNAVIRYSGELKVLTLQLAGEEQDTLRMDMFKLLNDSVHPKVQPKDGQVYNVRLYGTITLASGTRLMYSESFA